MPTVKFEFDESELREHISLIESGKRVAEAERRRVAARDARGRLQELT